MYSTKTIHKNYGTPFCSINDPYKSSIEALPSRWQKKQMSTRRYPLKNGFFTELEYYEEPYKEIAEVYSKTQPLDKRKLGFGSHDAFKPAEFTSTKATERYRHSIMKEKKMLDQHKKKHPETETNLAGLVAEERKPPRDRNGKPLKEPEFLFDIGRTAVNQYTPKQKSDSFYDYPKHAPIDPKLKGKDPVRRLGSHKTMSSIIGEFAWTHHYEKPQHGRKMLKPSSRL
ncbi:hypothetical protein CTEN210_15630 [Chaetoceros tenuissimus]|uniref:Uncharacterized protein n=1 Tax=Chaetoceros tenuissimus TaxID=426638 RepID=A0AAD3D7A8_9STRA|nr:hypothetical protein CTEN210_15630 [Chaetoceros tenuissimus]